MEGGDDRRRAPREVLTLKVEYADAAELVADYTENISRGGTFVLTDRELEEGAPLRLVLSFPGLMKAVPITGKVKWLRREPEAERGVGIEFDMASPENAQRMDALVQRIAEGDPALVGRVLRVLVVEDNPHVAMLIRDGLAGGSKRELGGRVSFEFETASDGREALERLAAHPFDALIIDIYLPVLDGAHVIATLRSDAKLAHLPVIAVSAGGQHAKEAALAAGADFFLDKPMRLHDILQTIRRLAKID